MGAGEVGQEFWRPVFEGIVVQNEELANAINQLIVMLLSDGSE